RAVLQGLHLADSEQALFDSPPERNANRLATRQHHPDLLLEREQRSSHALLDGRVEELSANGGLADSGGACHDRYRPLFQPSVKHLIQSFDPERNWIRHELATVLLGDETGHDLHTGVRE